MSITNKNYVKERLALLEVPSIEKSLFLSKQDIQSINLWTSKMSQFNRMDCHNKIINAESVLNLKYKVIGFGYTRIVFDLENGYVLKVATSSFGVRSNANEFDIYTKCPYKILKYFCPIKDYGKGWIVMEKMGICVPRRIKYDLQIGQIRNKFIQVGIKPIDMKRDNLALSNEGVIVVIDYGRFRR